jgi:hypothetical protein
MNRLAIELNNQAIAVLQAGNVIRAYELLSKSSNITMKAFASHTHTDTGNSTYRFHWEDCSAAFSNKVTSPGCSTWEGSVPFLFLRGLRVSTPTTDDDDLDGSCPCGFAWVIWYNLALCCSLLGTRLGERGLTLLKSAFDLYQKVQHRVDSEPPSRHWKIMQMALMNNQACIYYDLAMREATTECLERLARTLLTATDMQGEDRKGFFLNLQILGGHVNAPAA